MCRQQNIALESDGQTDDGQSDPYVSLCFAGDTKIMAQGPARGRGSLFLRNGLIQGYLPT